MNGNSPKQACAIFGLSFPRYNHWRNRGYITTSVGDKRKKLSEDEFQRLYRLVFLVDDCGLTIQCACDVLDAGIYTQVCDALRPLAELRERV